MSTGALGDGYETNHWKKAELNGGVYLGIMNPISAAHLTIPSYLTLLDQRAIDIIGWNMTPSVPVILPAVISDLQFIASSLTPNLQWVAGATAGQTQSVTVYSGTEITRSGKVYEIHDLSAATTNTVIPANELSWGTTYVWTIATVTPDGYAYSQLGSFTTRNPTCPWDLTGDELVEDADFSLFVQSYDLLDCGDALMPANCAADFDNNGVVDDIDFTAFVAAYNFLLCP